MSVEVFLAAVSIPCYYHSQGLGGRVEVVLAAVSSPCYHQFFSLPGPMLLRPSLGREAPPAPMTMPTMPQPTESLPLGTAPRGEKRSRPRSRTGSPSSCMPPRPGGTRRPAAAPPRPRPALAVPKASPAASKAANALRRRAAAVMVLGLSVLQTASVGPATLNSYVSRYESFANLAMRQRESLSTLEQIDGTLSQFLDVLYLDGEGLAEGRTTFAATVFCKQLGLGARLPRSRQALRGWSRLDPPHSRLPLPRAVVAAVIVELLLTGHLDAALWCFPSLELYLKAPRFKNLMETAFCSLKLAVIGPPHPYRLRHAGASHDFASKARRLSEVKRRGRWRSWASVRRYEKGARVAELLHKLPLKIRNHALRCEQLLERVVAGSLLPFPGP